MSALFCVFQFSAIVINQLIVCACLIVPRIVQEDDYNDLPDMAYNDEGELEEACKLHTQSSDGWKGIAAVLDGNHRAEISESSPVDVTVG